MVGNPKAMGQFLVNGQTGKPDILVLQLHFRFDETLGRA
jgi:hypothetical protein